MKVLLEGTADPEKAEKAVYREAEKYGTMVEVGTPGD